MSGLMPLQTFAPTGGGSGDTTPPAAPLLTLVVAGNGQISLYYTRPADADYDSGEIEYDDGVSVAAFPVTATGTYIITGLQNGTAYRLTARAVDNDGNWSSRSLARFAMPHAIAEGNAWARWISQSFFTFFKTQVSGLDPLSNIYFEGDNRKTNDWGDFFEVRVDNPIFKQLTSTLWHLESRFNILIQHPHSDDLFKVERMIGTCVSALPETIPVFMFEDTDPVQQVGCLERISEHKVHRYGKVGEKIKLTLTTVEVQYQWEVEE